MTREEMEMVAQISATTTANVLKSLGLIPERPVVRTFTEDDRVRAFEAVLQKFPEEAGFKRHRLLGDNVEYEDRPLPNNTTGQLVIVPVGHALDHWCGSLESAAPVGGPQRPAHGGPAGNGNGGKKANVA